MPDLVISPADCCDCGVSELLVSEKRLRRGRCSTCYRRFLRESKAAGTFEPLAASARPSLRNSLGKVFEGAVAGPAGCIIWTGRCGGGGYGTFLVAGRRTATHRAAYEAMVGPIPEGMLLDHTCHNRDETCEGRACIHRRCINPHHLEVVTSQENTLRSSLTMAGKNARKTQCYRGHEFTPENTRILASGRRACRECGLALQRKYTAEARAAGIARKR